MKSSSGWRLTVLLIVSATVPGATGFSQEKKGQPDLPPLPLFAPPIPIDSPVKPVPAAAPVALPSLRVTRTVDVGNGFRTITVVSNDLKLEISDTNGKQIILKHSRTIGEKMVTSEYLAEDLPELNSKSQEAAALYEQYALIPEVHTIQAPDRRVPARLVSSLFDDFSNHPGQRSIRVELPDRKVEIFDSADESILVRTTKLIHGKNIVDEFTADNLQQFKKLHPDAYLLYRRYTGLSAE